MVGRECNSIRLCIHLNITRIASEISGYFNFAACCVLYCSKTRLSLIKITSVLIRF